MTGSCAYGNETPGAIIWGGGISWPAEKLLDPKKDSARWSWLCLLKYVIFERAYN